MKWLWCKLWGKKYSSNEHKKSLIDTDTQRMSGFVCANSTQRESPYNGVTYFVCAIYFLRKSSLHDKYSMREILLSLDSIAIIRAFFCWSYDCFRRTLSISPSLAPPDSFCSSSRKNEVISWLVMKLSLLCCCSAHVRLIELVIARQLTESLAIHQSVLHAVELTTISFLSH